MATRARLSQDRSRLRRDALLAAAIELFAEGGSRAITHRAVAARAGLPPATTTYYFESIDALINEALSSHVGNWAQELKGFAAMPIDVDIRLEDATSMIVAIFALRPPEIVATQLSIYLAASRDPELLEQAGAALTAIEAIAVKLLGHIGIPDDGQLSKSLVAAILGSAVRRLSQRDGDEAEAEVLFYMVRGLIATEVIGDRAVSEALHTLS